MGKPTQITQSVQLLVEGNDQRNFFEAFIDHLSLGSIQIQNFGGVSELRGFLLALVNAPGFRQIVQSVGIIRDAETSPEAAFQSVQDSVRNAGLPIPDRPEERFGTDPTIVVQILPGVNRQGMLETLLCESFSDTPEDRCIDDFFRCIETNSSNGAIRRPEKARARAYLTTKPEPYLSVRVATKRGYWDLDHDTFADVRGFLEKITAIDPSIKTG